MGRREVSGETESACTSSWVDPDEYDRLVAGLEAAEDAADAEAYDEAKAADDGTRVPMAELLAHLGDVIQPVISRWSGENPCSRTAVCSASLAAGPCST